MQTVDGLNVLTCFSAVLRLLPTIKAKGIGEMQMRTGCSSRNQTTLSPARQQGSLQSDASLDGSPPTKSKELGSRLRQREATSRVLEVQVATWADNAV
jgi:hypothetical protein